MRDLHASAGPSVAPVSMAVDSPVGTISVSASSAGIIGVCLGYGRVYDRQVDPCPAQDHLKAAALQLEEYFAGERQEFHLPLDVCGTQFQQSVWQQAQLIPFAGTVTYGDIACRIDNPGAARAVGSALGANPVPLLIPCHRVIGAGGLLAGFSSGLATKRLLLGHEAGLLPRGQQLHGTWPREWVDSIK